jgi:putative transposase
VLAYMSFRPDHWSKIHSTNGLEWLNGEIKRRTEVVGIFSKDDALVRLVGAILLEQYDEWAAHRARYMTLETTATLSDDPAVGLPAMVI